jgi:hypothetical protein
LATRTDFNPGPTIQDAIDAHIFDKGDEKFLQLFNPSHKAIFDNVVHSVGSTALVDKDHLTTFMEPLSRLLSYVVV